MNSGSFHRLRAIKELLIKGAKREIRDNNNKRPVDLIDSLEDDTNKEELRKLLHREPHYLPCCHLRQPMRKI
jgi:hypothetical protein